MHEILMVDADRVARPAVGLSSPAPPVGCVILDRASRIVGRGATSARGLHHAEQVALAQAGSRAGGGTAVVTLEPCGKVGPNRADATSRAGAPTPVPCADLLTAAGVATVVYATADPSGYGGAGTLTDAGVTVITDVGQRRVRQGPLRSWLHLMATGRPWVTVSCGFSLDGRIAAADGTSRGLNGPAALADVHARRARTDAIVVGTGTVAANDPMLTALTPDGAPARRQPLRVVVGGRRPRPSARVLDGAAQTWLAGAAGAADVLQELARRGVLHTTVEGGTGLITSFLAADLVDEVVAYLTPVLLGAGPPLIGPFGARTLDEGRRFTLQHAAALGSDVLITALR